jgi:DNA helicase HerA-like ATPase
MAEPSVITIRTPGLSLPEPGASRETYTRAERVSVATLTLVAAKALRLVSTNRNRHKIVLLDEAWFFLSSAQGRALLNRLIRLARAFNATVVVATQRLADLGDLAELFGFCALFGQETEREAGAGLALFGLDSEGRLRIRLTEYRQGECLIRDLDGRVGEAQIDLVFPELVAALDNSPREVRA